MPPSLPAPLIATFNQHWRDELGAIDGHDLRFIHHLMHETRPRRVIEIGCCTGLSTGMMARILDDLGDEGGPRAIVSCDLAAQVYFAPEKPVGYLIDVIAPEPRTRIALHTGVTALDVADVAGPAPFDMAFIDASHQHPWPLIDTLCLMPLLAPEAVIIHHDLQLFRSETNARGVGPKMLFDRLMPRERITQQGLFGPAGDPKPKPQGLKTRGIDSNIFAFRNGGPAQAARLAEGFMLPWSLSRNQQLADDWSTRFAAFLQATHPPAVMKSFRIGRARYDPLARSRD